MWIPPLLRPLRAVAFDTLLALVRALPGVKLLESNNRPADGIPVFVMMPLDFPCDNPRIPAAEIEDALAALARAGVHGVMVDVWWGRCEPQPGTYDFALYGRLVETCRKLGLKVQATMCFHACGGNVGDIVDIPLPAWVESAADEHLAWFRDRALAVRSEGVPNKEYLSFGVDHLAFLPSRPKAGKVTGAAPSMESSTSDARVQQPSPTKIADNDSAVAGLASLVGDGGDVSSRVATDKGDITEAVKKADAPKASDVQTSQVKDTADAEMRTPLRAYADFIEAFCSYMSSKENDYMESTITELQVGVGPCGELRYPGYPMAEGKWKFPGIGEFQSYDPHLLKDLAKASSECANRPASEIAVNWSVPPKDAGSYNDTPFSTSFFKQGFKSAYGKFFQEWYSRVLLRHCDDMLTNVRRIVPAGEKSVALAVKISGIHWWYFTASRAAEATAGYYVSREYNFYEEAARLFRKHSVVFDFTCLEMKTINQPFLRARCGPKQLVREVFRVAAKEGVVVAGENALERYDWPAYQQIIRAFKWTNAMSHGFTLLRLTPALLEKKHLENLERLTREMRALKKRPVS